LRFALLLPAILVLATLDAFVPTAHARPPRPLRQHHSILEYLDFQDIGAPRGRRTRNPKPPPLECLGRAVHPPWQNPFSPLPGRLAERHQRITVSPGPATV
ncbi:MAG TPA: hypothetical protein PK095_05780, partial [Myxococcota bacterium]|nr:hypothetical protein [Myxococcota bacterium]